MRIHHLNCVSSCPLGGRLMDGRSPSILQRGELCCHCLLIETSQDLVLVDTGFGLRDVIQPRSRISPMFLALLSPDFREEMTAVRQIERLGFKATDVRHIVLTHLDFDHAGGLDDFPHATVHMMRQERDYALKQKTWLDRQRFRPQQWNSRQRWRVYQPAHGESWYGFSQVRDMTGLPPEILMVPLPGHTYGHAGVAIRTPERWLLQAGDAYFYHQEMDWENPRCTPGLELYQTLMEKDRTARLANQRRLRKLRQAYRGEIELFCAHDPVEFERLTGTSIDIPLGSSEHAYHPGLVTGQRHVHAVARGAA
ncbi:MBL fold metallo-hydrolase [Noviherbaspirillum galbum]|uniref:MBL fold metallo-hydrolase n=1 Tax=Noviherbaspirillum galbum TaxID=2709383 RepID=A0A6B3SG50_9BURK|nr:MBL fold metallo-hydrolase [Noviherbaspirillum galbum]NEX59590.1 MBL fold metallo-hydrolase [Noviherbaspirillum galbum]